MKKDLSSLFDNFLAKINWYINLLVKICLNIQNIWIQDFPSALQKSYVGL